MGVSHPPDTVTQRHGEDHLRQEDLSETVEDGRNPQPRLGQPIARLAQFVESEEKKIFPRGILYTGRWCVSAPRRRSLSGYS